MAVKWHGAAEPKAWQRIATIQLETHLKDEDVSCHTFDYDTGLAAQVRLGAEWAYSQDFDGDLAAVMFDHGMSAAKIGAIAGDYLGAVLSFHLAARRQELEPQGED